MGMNIVSVRVHNFRGFRDAEFSVGKYNLLVGANNSGKTTIIDAIRSFYGGEQGYRFDEDEDFNRDAEAEEESWIDIEFQKGTKRVRYRRYNKSLEQSRSGLYEISKKDGQVLVGAVSKIKQREINGGALGKLIYIPAVSVPDDATKLSGPSALKDIVANIVGDCFDNGAGYTKLRRSLSTVFKEIKNEKTGEGLSLQNAAETISQQISDWGVSFEFDVEQPSVDDFVKSMISWKIVDLATRQTCDLNRCGSGFQRMFIYELIKAAVEFDVHDRKSSGKVSKIVLFEEPETFLHSDQQDELARGLKDLARRDGYQVFCTTHSPHFLCRSLDNVPSIARVACDGGGRKVFNISQDRYQKILEDARNTPSHKQPDVMMAEIKYSLLLNPNRANAFFADHVLLVEGTSEEALINILVDEKKIRLPKGCVVLESMGKFNMPRFMMLLSDLGVRHSVLLDRDESKEQKNWNKYIETHRKKLTTSVEYLEPNLEKFLDVKYEFESWDKPQKLIHAYKRNEIDATRMKNFIDLVTKLVKDCSPLSRQ